MEDFWQKNSKTIIPSPESFVVYSENKNKDERIIIEEEATMRKLFAMIKRAGSFIVESFAYYDKVSFEANLGNRLYCIPSMGIPGGFIY